VDVASVLYCETARASALMGYQAELAVDRWKRVVMVGESGRRYEFTTYDRVLTIEDEDVQVFSDKQIKISRCGCTGGHRAGEYVYMFNVTEEV